LDENGGARTKVDSVPGRTGLNLSSRFAVKDAAAKLLPARIVLMVPPPGFDLQRSQPR
jgi:hypothetical protein